ncbi:site-specific integrase [Runella sp. SP2]|uniref:site-specific integrase n=1 Tax=Runella sp. SP2 TaxID=2268026 RepID=UPI000F09387A|nr:site-specific integrase [Runella sp. SP2]AYQ35804.1 hypothetical protein DTQ70_28140 [Runella sp. SP2]
MATVNLYFDTRATSANEGFIKIVITHNRVKRLYTTGIKTDAKQWEWLPKKGEKRDNRVKDETLLKLYADIYSQPNGFYRRAESIVEALGVNFSFDAFKDAFENWGKEKPAEDTDDVFAALKAKAEAMRKADRIGNASNYELAAKSLRRYVESMGNETRKEFGLPPRHKATKKNEEQPPTVLRFRHITPNLLTDYEHWMLHYGKTPQTSNPKKGNVKATGASLTTVGIYLRHVRAVVNDAIENGILTREAYPFGGNRYVIPAGQNVKKALSKDDVTKILRYECQTDNEQRARDLWVFSYLSNGMNLADVCALRWSDLDSKTNKLTFIRKKTARSKKGNQSKIVAKLFPESWTIIERQGNKDQKSTSYVFPFLNTSMSAERQKAVIHQVVKLTNKWMQRIGQTLQIEGDVNTYAARHSFATILLQSDAPLAFISQSLGHTNLKTTQSYLGSFDDEKTKGYLDALL